MRQSTISWDFGLIWVDGTRLTDLDFADDMVLIDSDVNRLQELTTAVEQEASKVGHLWIPINAVLWSVVVGKAVPTSMLLGLPLRQYLGSYISTTENCEQEVNVRIGKATGVFSKQTRQIMEEQENQFASENKALWSTSALHVAQQCRAVASLSHTNKKLEAAHHRWQRSILGFSWKDNVTNEKVREATADADIWDGLDIFHECITIDFRDKLSHGNLRVSGGQVGRDRTGKMSSRKIWGKWASAGMSLKRLQRTGGAGRIVSLNASLTRDEPRTRSVWVHIVCLKWPPFAWTYAWRILHY